MTSQLQKLRLSDRDVVTGPRHTEPNLKRLPHGVAYEQGVELPLRGERFHLAQLLTNQCLQGLECIESLSRAAKAAELLGAGPDHVLYGQLRTSPCLARATASHDHLRAAQVERWNG